MKKFLHKGICPIRDILSRLGYKWSLPVLVTNTTEVTLSNVSSSFYTHRRGDANVNGTITIADIVANVDYIAGDNPQPFLFEAGDVNFNQSIDNADVTELSNTVLDETPTTLSSSSSATLTASFSNPNTVSGMTIDLLLSLNNSESLPALQTDIMLPSFLMADTNKITLSERCAGTSIAKMRLISTNYYYSGSYRNRYRLQIYSTDNTPIVADNGRLLTIPLQSDWASVSDSYSTQTAYINSVSAVFETLRVEKSIATASSTFYIYSKGDVNISEFKQLVAELKEEIDNEKINGEIPKCRKGSRGKLNNGICLKNTLELYA